MNGTTHVLRLISCLGLVALATVFGVAMADQESPRPIDGLSDAEERRFAEGEALFRTRWQPAGPEDGPFGGLGPTYNARSCAGCHPAAGRGHTPAIGEPLSTVLLRIAVDGSAGLEPHPAYGAQLNPRAIAGVPPEGEAYVEHLAEPGAYGDGTPYLLLRPAYGLFRMAFGQLDDAVHLSPRMTPPLEGLGLLEAIPEEMILAGADPMDRDGDGISGRPNWHIDSDGRKRLGRLGWRAEQPSIWDQTATALHQDMGITSGLFPQENCPRVQALCGAAQIGGETDASDDQIDALAFYVRMLSPPSSPATDPVGAELFARTGCTGCHTPRFVTGEHPVAALSGVEFAPYTDLLLHDMGEALAAQRVDGSPGEREWRTPPLWGLQRGAAPDGSLALLHDGRARTVAEAILWHGGEAEAAREAFRTLPADEREALVRFVLSR